MGTKVAVTWLPTLFVLSFFGVPASLRPVSEHLRQEENAIDAIGMAANPGPGYDEERLAADRNAGCKHALELAWQP